MNGHFDHNPHQIFGTSMLIRFKQLTFSLLFIGFSATSWAQTVLIKTEKNIEEYKKDFIKEVEFLEKMKTL